MPIECNKELFAAYCGLIASGYDLTDEKDRAAQALALRIRTVCFSPEITAYFRHARAGRLEINPYYPRGSDLAAACFFLDRPLAECLAFLEQAGSPEAKDADFIAWIARLPRFLKKIEACGAFPALWQEHQTIIAQRGRGYQKVLTDAQSALDAHRFSDGTRLIFSPALLQAPCLADYVRRDKCLYLIASRCTMEAVLHEYLHKAVREFRPQWEALLAQADCTRFVNLERVRVAGYLRQDTAQERLHAFEDGVVRGLTGVLAGYSAHSAYARQNLKAGFLLVPSMLRYARGHSFQKTDLPGFVTGAAARFPDTTRKECS